MAEKDEVQKMSDKLVDQTLNFDPIDTAEKLGRESVIPIDAIEATGFGMHLLHSKNKKEMLKELGDTHMSMKIGDYLTVVEDEGFECVLKEPFLAKQHSADEVETSYIYWHPDGILLHFESFSGNINGGKFLYNWRPHKHLMDRQDKGSDEPSWYTATSSGGFIKHDAEDKVWSGDHDCREAFRFNIRRLREMGTFVTPWMAIPFLWLTHYGEQDEDRKYNNWKKDSAARAHRLPDHVKKAVFATKDIDTFFEEKPA